MMRLEPGRYLGQTVREQEHAGLLLTLSTYGQERAQPWHVHDYPTLYLLIAGANDDCTRHSRYRQTALTTVFHPTTTLHASEIGPRGMLGLNIALTPDWLERHQLTERDLGGYAVLDSPFAQLSGLRLLAATFLPDASLVCDPETHVLELLEPGCRLSTPAERCAEPRWLRRAEIFLRERFRQPISLRDVAGEACVHPVYCARVFRQRYGGSVSDYLRALRLAEAGRLITQQGCSLGAAAQEVGFADQAHFTRSCRQALGLRPRTLTVLRNSLRSL